MSDTSSRQRVEYFIEQIWNQERFELLDEVVSMPTVGTSALYAYQGPAGLRQLVDDFHDTFPNTQIKSNYFIGHGDQVAVNVTAVQRADTDEAGPAANEANSSNGAKGNGAANDAQLTEEGEIPHVDAVTEYPFYLFFQLAAGKIISAQSSPALELLRYLHHVAPQESRWEKTLRALKLPPRLEAVTIFLIASVITAINDFARMWRRRWRLPIFRAIVVIVTFALVVGAGLNLAHRFAAKVITTWLEQDFYYLKLPHQTRQLGTVNADGSKLVFAAESGDLVGGDHNDAMDIFIATTNLEELDDAAKANGTTTLTATISLVSVARDKGQADGWSRDPAITTDGRYVTFTSVATNLVENADYNSSPINLYVRDLECGMTYLVDKIFEEVNEADLSRSSINSNAQCGDAISRRNIAIALTNSPNALPALYWTDTTDGERQRLYQQQDRALGLAERHLEIVMFYYVRYFSAIIATALAALGAAIFLFFISRDGWNNNNDLLQIPFIGFVACSILFGAVPNVFEFSQNIEANKRAFVAALTLESQITSYISTGKVMGKTTDPNDPDKEIIAPVELEASAFIHRVDEQLAELFGLAIEMNPDEIPGTDEIIEQIQGTTQIPTSGGTANEATPGLDGLIRSAISKK